MNRTNLNEIITNNSLVCLYIYVHIKDNKIHHQNTI